MAQQTAPSFRAKRSGAPKSPRTMALAVSRGYVSHRNAGLTSSLSLSLLPQISNLKSQISNLKSLSSPLWYYVPSFRPQFGGAAKGKRLNGQARRLTSPHLEVLCRTSTVAQQTAPSFRAKRSEVEKSPCTMALAVSRGYVSRRNVSLKSDRLTSSLSLSLLPQISNLKIQISFLPLPQL